MPAARKAVKKADKKNPTAEALLAAHITWIEDRISGDALAAFVDKTLDDVLPLAKKLKLEECVSRKSVKAVATEYAADMEIHPAIPELVGDIARAIHASEALDNTTLDELVDERTLGELIDRILEMQDLREAVIHETVASPIFAGLVSDLLYGGIKDYLANNLPGRNLGVVKSATKIGQGMLKKARPGIEAEAEETIKRTIRKNIGDALKISERYLLDTSRDEEVRDYMLEVWGQIKDQPVGEFRQFLNQEDMESGFVAGFEFWKRLRQTELYTGLIHVGIDQFYDKYGKKTLDHLLAELGIDKAVMQREALRFAPQVIDLLRKKKLLAPLIRSGLEDFYHSDIVEGILAS